MPVNALIVRVERSVLFLIALLTLLFQFQSAYKTPKWSEHQEDQIHGDRHSSPLTSGNDFLSPLRVSPILESEAGTWNHLPAHCC